MDNQTLLNFIIMDKSHHYAVDVEWTGNTGEGTKTYRGYERSHSISVENKVAILGSSDPASINPSTVV